MTIRTRTRAALVTFLTSVALTSPSLLGATAHAAGYEKGAAPTATSISAALGPYAFEKILVPNTATPGFGAATIYAPTSTAEGTYGGVAIVPGFTGNQSAIAWLGPRLASHGFVVITIDTNSPFDQPPARGDQLLAALDYLTGPSAVSTRVDASRLAVMGHSMGGGGALEAAKDRPSLDATIGLSPWNLDRTWPEIATPSLVVGAERDTTAPVSTHAKAFYNGMTNAPEKAYLELNEAGHSAVTASNTTVATNAIAWLKRFVDLDTRYSQFICPGPAASQNGAVSSYPVSAYWNSCPV
jgi:dienelactone hydrolase